VDPSRHRVVPGRDLHPPDGADVVEVEPQRPHRRTVGVAGQVAIEHRLAAAHHPGRGQEDRVVGVDAGEGGEVAAVPGFDLLGDQLRDVVVRPGRFALVPEAVPQAAAVAGEEARLLGEDGILQDFVRRREAMPGCLEPREELVPHRRADGVGVQQEDLRRGAAEELVTVLFVMPHLVLQGREAVGGRVTGPGPVLAAHGRDVRFFEGPVLRVDGHRQHPLRGRGEGLAHRVELLRRLPFAQVGEPEEPHLAAVRLEVRRQAGATALDVRDVLGDRGARQVPVSERVVPQLEPRGAPAVEQRRVGRPVHLAPDHQPHRRHLVALQDLEEPARHLLPVGPHRCAASAPPPAGRPR
jgi:hypothetical protein